MNNLSVQTQFGWCAVHNLINLLRDTSFAWALSEERFKGSHNHDEEELLSDRNLKIINLVNIREEFDGLPYETIWNVIYTIPGVIHVPQDRAVLLLMVVKRGPTNEYTHRVGIIVINNRYFYTDPWNEEFKQIESISDLVGLFYRCYSIDTLCKEIDYELRWVWFEHPDYLELINN